MLCHSSVWDSTRACSWLLHLVSVCLHFPESRYVALYASIRCWKLLAADIGTLEAFHMKCQRQMLNIHWWDHITNVEVLQKTGLSTMREILRNRRLSLFGHVARLDPEVPANKALLLMVNSLNFQIIVHQPPLRHLWVSANYTRLAVGLIYTNNSYFTVPVGLHKVKALSPVHTERVASRRRVHIWPTCK